MGCGVAAAGQQDGRRPTAVCLFAVERGCCYCCCWRAPLLLLQHGLMLGREGGFLWLRHPPLLLACCCWQASNWQGAAGLPAATAVAPLQHIALLPGWPEQQVLPSAAADQVLGLRSTRGWLFSNDNSVARTATSREEHYTLLSCRERNRDSKMICTNSKHSQLCFS